MRKAKPKTITQLSMTPNPLEYLSTEEAKTQRAFDALTAEERRVLIERHAMAIMNDPNRDQGHTIRNLATRIIALSYVSGRTGR